MRTYIVGLVGVLGCGSVKGPPGQQQDAAGAGDSAPACTVHDTIDSCGATCTKCPAADERQVPTCDGTACGVACTNAAAKCTDGSCARFAWTFDSNMLDGITPEAPAGLALAVRNHAGNLALAIDVTNLSEVLVMIPVCVTGNIQLQTKTLSATVFFDGPSMGGEQYYVQGIVPAPMTGAFLSVQGLAAGAYFNYAAPMSMSQFANTAANVTLKAGTFGEQFSGTIWFDDIKIQ